MSCGLWVVQGLLAVVFLYSGAKKLLVGTNRLGRSVVEGVFAPRTVRLLGGLEVLGAVGLIVPALTGILPWLTPLAAAGVGALMVPAAGFNLRHGHAGAVPVNAVLLGLSGLVVAGRTAGLADDAPCRGAVRCGQEARAPTLSPDGVAHRR
jgi:hypothetical protein